MNGKLFVTAALLSLVAGPAMATDSPGHNGKSPSKNGLLIVGNNCDAAVIVELSTGNRIVLEPFSSIGFSFSIKGKTMTVDVTATLSDDPSVTATASCLLKRETVTWASISCSTTTSPPTLSIECLAPGEAPLARLDAERKTDALVAAFGSLAIVLFLSTFPGVPRRPESPAAGGVPKE